MAFTSTHVSLKGQWKSFFEEACIPTAEAEEFADKFASEKMLLIMLPDLNEDRLQSLGITLLGYKIAILKHAKKVIEKNPNLSDYQLTKKKEPPRSKPAIETVVKEQPKIVKVKATPEINRTNFEVNGHKASETLPTVKRKAEKIDPVVAAPTTVAVTTDDIEEIEEVGFVKKTSIANNDTKIVRTINSTVVRNMTNTVKSTDKREDNDTNNSFGYSDDDDDDNVKVTINDSVYRMVAKNSVVPDNSRKCTVIRKGIFMRLGDESSQPRVTSTTHAGDDDTNQSNRIVLAEKTVFDRLGTRGEKSSVDDKPRTSIEIEKPEKPVVVTRNLNVNEDFRFSKTIKYNGPTKTEFIKRINNPPGTREVKSVLQGVPTFKRKIEMTPTGSGKASRSLYMDAEEGKQKKRVTFGESSNNVRTIPSRAEAIRNGEIPDGAMEYEDYTGVRRDVFSRLSINHRF